MFSIGWNLPKYWNNLVTDRGLKRTVKNFVLPTSSTKKDDGQKTQSERDYLFNCRRITSNGSNGRTDPLQWLPQSRKLREWIWDGASTSERVKRHFSSKLKRSFRPSYRSSKASIEDLFPDNRRHLLLELYDLQWENHMTQIDDKGLRIKLSKSSKPVK